MSKVETWATHISKSPMLDPVPVGFDPITIITLLSALIPVIIKLCEMHNKPDDIKARAATLLLKNKKTPNARARRVMKQKGLTDKADQNRVWLAMLTDAASSDPQDFVETAAEIDWSAI